MCVISAVLFIIIVFFSFCSFPLNIHILCVHFIFHQNSIGSERQQLPGTKFSVCYLHIICIHSYMDRGSNHMATAIQPLKCVYVYGTRRISPSIYWFSAHTQNCLFLIYEFPFFFSLSNICCSMLIQQFTIKTYPASYFCVWSHRPSLVSINGRYARLYNVLYTHSAELCINSSNAGERQAGMFVRLTEITNI